MIKRRGQLSRADAEALADALVLLLRVLSPFAPHFSEGLLIEAGREGDVELLSAWPQPGRVAILIRRMFELQQGNLDKRRMRFAKAGGLPSWPGSCSGR